MSIRPTVTVVRGLENGLSLFAAILTDTQCQRLMTAGIITGINLITTDTIIAVGLLYGRGKVFRGRG